MADELGGKGHTRRSFLDLVLGLTVVGWLTTLLYPIFRYLTPITQTGFTGPVRLSSEDEAGIQKNGFVITQVGGSRVLVLQDQEEGLHAVDAKCTHEGCTVRFVPGESVIWCACHNARFDLEGRVLSGPPPRPLPKHVVERDADGIRVVLGNKA